jgi:rod shape determining protein RodA
MSTVFARDPRSPFTLLPGAVPAFGQRRPRHDWILTGTALALALIGAVLVWAATRSTQQAAGADPNGFL